MQVKKQKCDPSELKFVEEYIKCGVPTFAAVRVWGDQLGERKNKKRDAFRMKASRLMKEPRIQNAIESRRAVMDANASLGAQRIQTIILEGKDREALDASKFSIEQVDGRAIQTVNTIDNTIKFSIDLTSALLESPDEKDDNLIAQAK